MPRPPSLLLCLALIATACGGDDAPPDAEAFMTRLVEHQCELAFDCCTDAEREALSVGVEFEDAAACAATLDALLAGLRADVLAAIDAGRIRYDAAAAARCVDSVEALGCDALDVEPPACRAPILIGLVANGDACAIDEECAGGLCEDDACATAPEVDEPPPAEDAPTCDGA
jgi:hypothetical protein